MHWCNVSLYQTTLVGRFPRPQDRSLQRSIASFEVSTHQGYIHLTRTGWQDALWFSTSTSTWDYLPRLRRLVFTHDRCHLMTMTPVVCDHQNTMRSPSARHLNCDDIQFSEKKRDCKTLRLYTHSKDVSNTIGPYLLPSWWAQMTPSDLCICRPKPLLARYLHRRKEHAMLSEGKN